LWVDIGMHMSINSLINLMRRERNYCKSNRTMKIF
jgi:hypothetical protein